MYNVLSCTDVTKHYEVTITHSSCAEKPSCIPQCTSNKCQYLCRHMFFCACWDYAEGHVCKQCHKIQSVEKCTLDTVNDIDEEMCVVDYSSSYVYDPEVNKESKAGTPLHNRNYVYHYFICI